MVLPKVLETNVESLIILLTFAEMYFKYILKLIFLGLNYRSQN